MGALFHIKNVCSKYIFLILSLCCIDCICFVLIKFVLFLALFMVIGFIVYAVEKLKEENMMLSWSYALSVISSIFCLAAGILSVVQLRSAGVRM